jgi:hypothetical protein
VTGFTEGEGAFTYSRSGRQLALYFAIKLTAADRSLLANLQGFFDGAGRIYRVAPRQPRSASGWTKTAVYYRVCRREDLERIVAHFDKYPLRGAKSASYRIWRQMVVLKRRFRRPNRAALDVLAARLSSTSSRKVPWSSTDLNPPAESCPPETLRPVATASETSRFVSAARPAPAPISPSESAPPTTRQGHPATSSTPGEARQE